jgi:hypothetical protein
LPEKLRTPSNATIAMKIGRPSSRPGMQVQACVLATVCSVSVPSDWRLCERTRARHGVRVENRAGCLELLLRADATATTTMHSSPQRVASRGVHVFVIVSIGRKVWLSAKQANSKSTPRDRSSVTRLQSFRLVHATGEGGPDTVMCNAEGDRLESDRSPMDSYTYVANPVDDFSD